MQNIPQMRTLPQLAEEFKWLKEGRFPYLTRGRRFIVNRDRFIDFLNTADERETI